MFSVNKCLIRLVHQNAKKSLAFYSSSSHKKTATSSNNENQTLFQSVDTLDNGLKVASQTYGTQTCSVGLFVDAGSRYDGERTAGVAHLLEHVVFKSTAKRPPGEIERQALERGARVSASTSREMNAFYVHVLKKDLSWAIEVLSDIAKNSTFDITSVENSKDHILEEIQELDSDIRFALFDYLHATAYQGTDLARPVIGQPDTLKALNSDDLSLYVKSHFKGPRMALAVTGGVSHNEVLHLAQQHGLSSVPFTYEDSEIPIRKPVRFTGSEIRHRDDAYPLAHIALAVEGPEAFSTDCIALQVATAVNGSWDLSSGGGANVSGKLASPLFGNCLVHSFDNFFIPYHDTSLFGIYFTAREQLDSVAEFFQSEMMRISTQLTDFDVERARNALKTKILSQYAQGGMPVACANLGWQLINYNRCLPLDELLFRIDQVSSTNVREVMDKYFYDKCPAIASFGPIESLLTYIRLRKNMYLLRR